MSTEIWKPIPDAAGYEVSNLGNVRNANKITHLVLSILNGYYKVNLGKYGTYLVHRLVAQTFIPNSENKPQVNHINGNKRDNRVENLEWVTASENAQHALRTGLKVYTPEVCKAISNSLKGKPKSEEARKKYSEYSKNRTPEHIKHLSDAHKGKHHSEEHKEKLRLSQQGKIWVNNGISRTMIRPEELQQYIDKGYVKGMCRTA